MPLATSAVLLPLLAALPFLAGIVIKSLPLLLFIWLLHACLKKRQPQWHVYLWRAAAVALLLLPAIGLIQLPVLAPGALPQESRQEPASVAVAPSAAASAAVTNAADWESAQPVLQVEQQQSLPTLAIRPTLVTLPDAVAASDAQAESAGIEKPSAFSFINWKAFYVLWGAGILVLLVRLLAGAFATRLLLRRASPCAPRIQELAEAVATASGIGRLPAIRETAELGSPALCSVFKPVLLIPSAMVADASTDELKAILSHELAHFKANDLQWNLLIQIAAILYWVNPLAWRMRIAHLSACELLADAASARASGGVDAYSQLLARVALAVNAKHQHTGLAMARSANVLRRIRQLPVTLAQAPIRRRWLASALAVFTLICVATGSTLVVRAKAELPPAAPSESDVAPLDNAVALLENATARFGADAASLKVDTGQNEPTATPVAEPATPFVSAQQEGRMDVRIIDEQGEPIADAQLRADYSWGTPSPVTSIDKTGDGTFRIVLDVQERMAGSLQLYADAPGYVSLTTQWSPVDKDAMPQQYTFQMEGAAKIGGRVVGEDGNAIAGATVTVSLYKNTYPSGFAYPYLLNYPVTTDAEGYWTCDKVPQKTLPLTIRASHQGYEPFSLIDLSLSYEKLRNESFLITLKPSHTYNIIGTVTLPDGSPAEGVELRTGQSSAPNLDVLPAAQTDAEGRYRFTDISTMNGWTQLYAALPGYAPQHINITLENGDNLLDIQLQAGSLTRIKVVDPSGNPIEGVQISKTLERFERAITGRQPSPKTDANGEWEWALAPESPTVYNFYKDGYIQKPGIEIAPPGETVVLLPAVQIELTVVDATTGEPIPYFSVLEYWVQNPNWSSYWQSSRTRSGTDGSFEFRIEQILSPNAESLRIGVNAPGYMLQEKPLRLADASPVRLHYALEKSIPVSGYVVSPDGAPLANIEVTLIARKEEQMAGIRIVDGALQSFYPITGQVITDANGHFSFSPTTGDYTLLVLRNDGYASARYRSANTEPLRLTLTPWMHVYGQLELNPGEDPVERRMKITSASDSGDLLFFSSSALTNAQGEYRFNYVGSNTGKLSLNYLAPLAADGEQRIAMQSGTAVRMDFQPGKTVRVDYDAQGLNVVGKFDFKAMPEHCAWERAFGTFSTDDPYARKQPPTDGEGGANYSMSISPEGAFRLDGVKPGEYNVNVSLFGEGERYAPRPALILKAIVTVPEGKPGEAFDLGAITMQVREP